jgi:hypothetical protein
VLEARGRIVPLPIALRTGAATDAARRLVGDGERRLRAIAERVPPAVLGDAEWRPLDPTGETLRDVDQPGDLPGADGPRQTPQKRRTRPPEDGRVREEEGRRGLG